MSTGHDPLWALLPFISCDLGAEQPLEASDVLGLGREPAEPSRGVITDQGNVVVPLDPRDFGLWLKGLMGSPTTTGTTPAFVHVFTSGAASLPSLSLELGFPEVPRYFQNLGCLVGSIKLPWAVSGRANATVALIGQGETNSAASVAGTPTSRTLRRFQQSMGFIRKDGAPLGLVTAGEIDPFRRAGRPANPGAGRHQARPSPGDPPPPYRDKARQD